MKLNVPRQTSSGIFTLIPALKDRFLITLHFPQRVSCGAKCRVIFSESQDNCFREERIISIPRSISSRDMFSGGLKRIAFKPEPRMNAPFSRIFPVSSSRCSPVGKSKEHMRPNPRGLRTSSGNSS